MKLNRIASRGEPHELRCRSEGGLDRHRRVPPPEGRRTSVRGTHGGRQRRDLHAHRGVSGRGGWGGQRVCLPLRPIEGDRLFPGLRRPLRAASARAGNPFRVAGDEGAAQDLQEPRQDDDVDALLVEQLFSRFTADCPPKTIADLFLYSLGTLIPSVRIKGNLYFAE